MPYQRKTRDLFEIRGNYGQGFELVTAETTRRAALENLRLYRENEPGIAFKLVKVREPIAPGAKPNDNT